MSRKKPPDTRAALLQGVLDAPDDDAPRLVYADWLEEHGDADDRDRAEFIRMQCRRAQLAEHDPEAIELRLRAWELHARHLREWGREVPSWLPGVTFRRGFVAGGRPSLEDFVSRGDELFSRAPLEEVTFPGAAGMGSTYYLPSGLRWMDIPHLERLRRLELLGLMGGDLRPLLGSGRLAGLRSLALSGTQGDTPGLPSLAGAKLASLRHLALHRVGLAVGAIRSLLTPPRESALEGLSLSETGLRAPDLEWLINRPQGRLRSFSLAGTSINPEGVAALAGSFGLAGLTDLSLGAGIATLVIEHLARSPYLGSLRRLRLTNISLLGDPARALSAAPFLSGLTVLELPECTLGAAGATALAEGEPLVNLRQLSLSNNALTSRGVQALARSLRFGRVQALDLWRNYAGEIGAAALAQSPHFGCLRELNLAYNSIGDNGAASLAQSPLLGQLVDLDLRGNHIGPAGAEALARSPHLAGVRMLNLSDNPLGRGAAALAESPHLEHIARLWLATCRIPADLKGVLKNRFGTRVEL